MPYSANRELPESVRGHLPEHAQSIYREAFNSGLDETHSEARAARIGWAAVKHSYKKRAGQWVRREG